MEVQFVFPARSKEPLCDMLVEITRAIDALDPNRIAHGFLGGEHGYGGHWDSAVFEMRPYYWGDCDCGYEELEWEWTTSHTHSDNCYQAELRREKIAAGGIEKGDRVERPKHLSYDQWRDIEDGIYDRLCAKFKRSRKLGCAAHCTCAYDREWKKFSKANGHKPTCSLELPNFLHRASGLEVRWYRYIGRGMEVENLPSDLTPIFNECIADIALAAATGTAKTPKAAGTATAADCEDKSK